MESRNNNTDFEQFLKQNADQYRMFPSENVWKGIDNALHTRRRWYGLGLALLLLLTGAGVTWVMLSNPATKQHTTVSPAASEKTAVSVPVVITPVRTDNKNTSTANSIVSGPQIYSYPSKSPVDVQQSIADAAKFVTGISDIALQTQPTTSFKENNNSAITHSIVNNTSSLTDHITSGLVVPLTAATAVESQAAPAIVADEVLSTSTSIAVSPVVEKEVPLYPMTIESVINSYRRPRSGKGISLQLYIAPNVSYRKLSENKAFLRSAVSSGTVPASVAYRDVNTAVTHKPDIGIEVGVAAKYALSKTILLRAGLQFNISRYDIRAYNNPGEIATIALDAGTGTNSISQETIYRNYNGNRANWLQNLYYSASIPLGVELKFPSKKSTYFAIAGTIQPTYIITDRAYLLSTDYKNYVEVPSLIRRWNMNTGFEALVGYTAGKTEWQIGPQVRYQIRSSFEDQYPLKENLFDFGLKVGVLLNK
ncbi:MAG TPA: hypothetical protein VFZ42_00365 [Chitinophagaceae bacterium]